MIRKIGLALLLAGCTATVTQAGQDKDEERETATSVIKSDEAANILRLAPITAMDIGYGFGLSYERLFGKDKNIGIILPFSLLLEKRTNSGFSTSGSNNTYFYFTPGLKVYPFGQRRITYAVGPSLMFGYGENADNYGYFFPNGTTSQEDIKLKKFRLGFMVNNYISFQITKALNIGFEGGIGMRYLDREYFHSTSSFWGSDQVQFRNGFNITGQFSMTLGIKF
jgi:hypothetical protein